MKVIKHDTYRSQGRGINHTDDRVRVTIDCSVNEFRRYFKYDENLRNLEMADTALAACQKIDEFHLQVHGTGGELYSRSRIFDLTKLNEAYDLAYNVIQHFKNKEK